MSDTNRSFLSFNDVTFAYGQGERLIHGINFKIQKGETVAMLGASGSGKSTLLRLAAGLLSPVSGHVERSSDSVSFVFQDAALLPWSTVADNVALPLKLRGAPNSKAVEKALARVGLTGFEKRYPSQLSGGQRMRVSIARALAAGGDLFCFDEPFSALDELLRFSMNDLVLDLASEQGWTTLFVTHSLYEACYVADRILVLREGSISAMLEVDKSAVPDRAAWRQSPDYLNLVKRCEQTLQGKEGEAT